MSKTPFGHNPTLIGSLITLRPIAAADADTVVRIVREDPDIARLTGSVHFSTEQLEGMPIEDLRDSYGGWATADARLVLAVVDAATQHMVGEVVLNEWDEDNRSCSYRTLIGAEGRGRGLGTEATRMVVQHALTGFTG
ncbi:GNAT family N-acetyltransferase [Humibacillus sp. DSM 29435]|uniref:GNAT family N-acetyltransferase n=1 Tax=Humibacillus sp. DSM 29435 TaxID=1869167 RepID=UPI0020C7803C|nr:GNAT family N-acetyltransferase [Humibacillus sp. DSM 29435]